MSERRKKIGVFGGSFNPIHIGHTSLANWICEYAGIDEVWFVVSPLNPLKDGHGMLSDIQKQKVIDKVRRHLLTPNGLRTLSPRNPMYHGHYTGDQPSRDRAYHQGTAWPWLLEHYVKANFDLYGKDFINEATEILQNFEEDISVSGIASINEIYDGDPPHNPRGAISQAWSVGAILRIDQMIKAYSKLK